MRKICYIKSKRNVRSISDDRKLCKDCIYNESSYEGYSAKIICGKHSKVVNSIDEACENYEV